VNIASIGGSTEHLDRPVSELIGDWLDALRKSLPERIVALYRARNAFEAAVVRIWPYTESARVDGYSLEHRFAAFLAAVETRGLRAVPTFLSPWLALDQALVLPVGVCGRVGGALVLDGRALERRDAEVLQTFVSVVGTLLSEREERQIALSHPSTLSALGRERQGL
jgi:hypothetical protein